MFWWMVIGGFIVPAVFVAVTKAKSVPAVVIAAILVNVGMWIERYLIVVPTMATPQTPSVIAPYWPSWVEWSILAGAVAGFGLLLLAFCRLFPVVSMWEVAEKAPTPVPEPTPAEVAD
jgi:molybdopterin-containing oxidoreductase family membrane subunit